VADQGVSVRDKAVDPEQALADPALPAVELLASREPAGSELAALAAEPCPVAAELRDAQPAGWQAPAAHLPDEAQSVRPASGQDAVVPAAAESAPPAPQVRAMPLDRVRRRALAAVVISPAVLRAVMAPALRVATDSQLLLERLAVLAAVAR
jgi:hypothetical protein